MKTKILIAALALLAVACVCLEKQVSENLRLKANQHALMSEIRTTRNRLGESVAECEQLRLSHRELRRLRHRDAQRIRKLGISLRHARSLARSASLTQITTATPLHDTVILRDTIRDTLRFFRWRDQWVRIDGRIDRDSVFCRVESVDTLRQIVYRVPRRFLFFRWGTKAVRQQITSSNPHTRIVYTEYLHLRK